LGNCGPTEGFFDAPSSCIPEAPAFPGILKQAIDPGGKIPRKPFRINGKTRNRILIEGN
jgi:hypothetical protein